MYIEPNTIIKVYHNVPLDNTYDHTLYFASEQAQTNYFHNTSGIVKKTFGEQTYQRVMKGKMRVEAKAEELYDCNYLAFKNSNFPPSKWFYAFITGVEYVNNATTEITYEIDSLQTYMFDVELKRCFVEREHSEGDTIEYHFGKENLDIGEYQYDQFSKTGIFTDWCILCLSPYNYKGETPEVSATTRNLHYANVGSGCIANVITSDNCSTFGAGGASTIWEGLWEWLAAMTRNGNSESIVSITMIPSKIVEDIGMDLRADHELPNYNIQSTPTTFKCDNKVYNTKHGTYTAKNKKLAHYPYSFLGFMNTEGEMAEYHWELFATDDSYCRFTIVCDPITNTYMLTPLNYNGTDSSQTGEVGTTNRNLSNTLTMTGIPLCSYNYDAFTIWFSQNKVSAISNPVISGIGSMIGGAISTASGNVPGTVASSISLAHTVGNSIGQFTHQASLPKNVRGGSNGSAVYFAQQFQDFMYTKVHLTPSNAKIIDDYFTMYGYATNRLKVPNRHVRERWTYTKTRGCVIEGNAPADDVRKICSIYDNGITFWVNASEVGKYNLSNNCL